MGRFSNAFARPFRGHSQPEDRYLGGVGLSLYGVLLIAIGLSLFSALIELWPAVDDGGAAPGEVGLFWGLLDVDVTEPTALILLAVLMGALGGFVHAATSFGSYAGNRNFKMSWIWWYWLRLPIGAALALGFYFVIRGGLIGVNGTTEINPYGIAAFTFVTGLFSKQATDKLEELFDTLFKVHDTGDAQRGDKLGDRPPIIRRLQPQQVQAGQPRDLKIHGQAFKRGATVEVNGASRDARLVDESELEVRLKAEDLRAAGTLRIAVVNPDNDRSNAAKLKVQE